VKRLGVLAWVLMFGLPGQAATPDWQLQPVEIQTRWARLAGPHRALPEYPRPQLVRPQWQNLNGLWRFAITAADAGRPAHYQGHILVPYPVESALSGVERPLQADQSLWYQRRFKVDGHPPGARTLLHFGAVDYQARIYVNGRQVGSHTGGYQSFTFDITESLRPDENELLVKVEDPTDSGPNPHWKQTSHPETDNFTATSGLWQTVWLENVPATHITGLTMTPNVDLGQLDLSVALEAAEPGDLVEAIATRGSAVVARQIVRGSAALSIAHPRLWSPEDPFLYGLRVRILRRARMIDEVTSYFGLRKIEVKQDPAGIDRIYLNGRYTFNLGTLDTGYWPEGIYTAPTDAALAFDIRVAKAMGFNTIRKHVKIEPDRWYYHCDRLGMMVWQDMVPPSDGSPESRAEFEREVRANLAQLHNHPSITTWTLFNEEMGPYDVPRLTAWVKRLDPSRLVNAHSGAAVADLVRWANRLDPASYLRLMAGDPALVEQAHHAPSAEPLVGDVSDIHHYPEPALPPAAPGMARVAGEYGGLRVWVDGHLWSDAMPDWGDAPLSSSELAIRYADGVTALKDLETRGLSGSIYTMPYDVEGELDGLLTYDRAIVKIPLSDIAAINRRIVPSAPDGSAAVKQLALIDADRTPEATRYAQLLEAYRQGNRDRTFLRDFALMANRQGDHLHATEAGSDYLATARAPYTKDTWAFIEAVTQSAQDVGFGLLRTQTDRADEALGPNRAEKKIREVIRRESIEPRLADKHRPPDWAQIEHDVIDRYGILGAEEIYGVEMMDSFDRGDWARFGDYYRRYFSTALERSEYPINNLSYVVFTHLSDPAILDAAIAADGFNVSTFRQRPEFRAYAVEYDTYANLLYKAQRPAEAMQWEERANQLSEGRDPQIARHLDQMKRAQPTWPTD
jgi:Glycosyl hydrolases family 2, sugar binding domain/Glycosyl hydrolases family 2/Glycosyl hydrolases family 2, TIM barrel domain